MILRQHPYFLPSIISIVAGIIALLLAYLFFKNAHIFVSGSIFSLGLSSLYYGIFSIITHIYHMKAEERKEELLLRRIDKSVLDAAGIYLPSNIHKDIQERILQKIFEQDRIYEEIKIFAHNGNTFVNFFNSPSFKGVLKCANLNILIHDKNVTNTKNKCTEHIDLTSDRCQRYANAKKKCVPTDDKCPRNALNKCEDFFTTNNANNNNHINYLLIRKETEREKRRSFYGMIAKHNGTYSGLIGFFKPASEEGTAADIHLTFGVYNNENIKESILDKIELYFENSLRSCSEELALGQPTAGD